MVWRGASSMPIRPAPRQLGTSLLNEFDFASRANDVPLLLLGSLAVENRRDGPMLHDDLDLIKDKHDLVVAKHLRTVIA